MAKSLRSKWRRKCRAIKRIRYGEKELARLKKTLGIDDETNGKSTDLQISDARELVTVIDPKSIKEAKQDVVDEEQEGGNMSMEIDGKEKRFNLKTMKDQHGSAPVWMHQRKVKRQKKDGRKAKKHRH